MNKPKATMPDCVKAFLNGLNEQGTDDVWAWLLDNDNARNQMIGVLGEKRRTLRASANLANHLRRNLG